MNMTIGTVFTTLYFLCNLQMGPKAQVLYYIRLERIARKKHSSLLGPFESYQENKNVVNTGPDIVWELLFEES